MNFRKISPALVAVTAGAAGLVAGVAITGGASAAPAAQHKASACVVDGIPLSATKHVIPKGASLAGWDARHGTYASNTITYTAMCAAPFQSLTMESYVNAGNWHARFGSAVTVWTYPWHK